MRDGRHGGVVWWDSVVNSYVCRCGSFQPHTPNFVIGAAHRSMIWGDEGPFSPSCQSHSAPPFRLGTVYRSLRPPPPVCRSLGRLPRFGPLHPPGRLQGLRPGGEGAAALRTGGWVGGHGKARFIYDDAWVGLCGWAMSSWVCVCVHVCVDTYIMPSGPSVSAAPRLKFQSVPRII